MSFPFSESGEPPKTCWKRFKVKWLMLGLCCLASGVVGGLTSRLFGSSSTQTVETDTTQVSSGGMTLGEVDDKMMWMRNNISRYFSSKINVLSKTVNQISSKKKNSTNKS